MKDLRCKIDNVMTYVIPIILVFLYIFGWNVG